MTPGTETCSQWWGPLGISCQQWRPAEKKLELDPAQAPLVLPLT